MKKIYTGMDIGSDSIKVIVCELYQGKLNLLAATTVASNGIKKGLIVDPKEVGNNIKTAFANIEMMIGVKIKKVVVNIPEYFSEFTMIKGEITIDNEENKISSEDVNNVIEEAIKKKKSDKELVNIIPIDFNTDDKKNVLIPLGLTSKTLSMRAMAAYVPKKNIYSILSTLESINIEVVDISLNSIGDGFAFKTKEMEEQTGAIINIGSETITISLYNKGVITKSSVISDGSSSIDNDLVYMYKIDYKTAIKLKECFALAIKRYANPNDFYEITTSYKEKIKVNQFEVSEVCQYRIEALLGLVKEELAEMTNKELDYIILTGGTTSMMHFEYVAKEILSVNASIGNVKFLGLRNNKYSSIIGNVIYFINMLKLRGKRYSMFSQDDEETISSPKKNIKNNTNDSMLGKVFGYFFGE